MTEDLHQEQPSGAAARLVGGARSVLRPRARIRGPRIRAGAVIAIALLVGFVIWLAVRGGSSSSPTALPPRTPGAVPISVQGLRTIAALGVPIYWVGRKPGFTYELTKTADDRVFIRYLPAGVPVGSRDPYLTVATYPLENAFTATSRLAAKSGSVKVAAGPDAVAFYSGRRPTNIYVAYRGSSSQIEVYDPSATEALGLVASGQLSRVSASVPATAGISATTPGKLSLLAASLSDPIYWAGARPGVTYELTRTSGGRIYLRYLPAGVPVGTKQAYLTIGTYPVKDAFAATQRQSRTAGAVRVEIGGGAVAFYNTSRPTNVYVAYPGADVQVEVYDPAPGRARALVASGSIAPVG